MSINLKYTPRADQEKLLQFFQESIMDEKKYILIDAPTGIGKSFAAIMMMHWYQNTINKKAKFDIVTNSKILQTQYVQDFPEIASLWGKGNYQCDQYGTTCEEGREICKIMGKSCEECPWSIAFEEYVQSEIGLTNFHLLCRWAQFLPGIFETRAANILFVDEAHEFDEVFCDMIAVNFNRDIIKRYDLTTRKVEEFSDKCDNIESAEMFVDTLSEFRNVLFEKIEQLKLELIHSQDFRKKEIIKKMKWVDGMVCRYGFFLESYAKSPSNWILESEEDYSSERKIKIGYKHSMQPLWAGDYLREAVWSRYDHIVMMSGTILDKSLFCYLNGLSEKDTVHIQLDSPFPVENRPISFNKLGKMSYTEKKNTWQKFIPFIKNVLNEHEEYKGIIHCGTYEIANWIKRDIPNKRFIFHTSADRDQAIEKHFKSKKPTILVSPSMMNGLDLHDDLSRLQIILKVPYPSLASNKIKRRMELCPSWYQWKTACDVIQSYGRSIRSESDWAHTYILDSNFGQLAGTYKNNFPKFFKEAFKNN